MNFYIPPNINNDFQNALNSNLGTSFIINFNSLDIVRAIVPELDYRAKQNGTNGTKPLYSEIDKLKIGDYIQDDENTYIVAFLKNQKFPLCSKIQAQVCNSKVTISHFQKEVTNNNGDIITPESDVQVAADIYSVVMLSGYEFRTSSGSVGIVPNDLIGLQIQFNDITKNVQIGDTFYYFGSKYRIENIDYSQVSIDLSYGIMLLFARKIS